MIVDLTEKDIVRDWGRDVDPLVSICCITYNHEAFIEDALNGFLAQKTTFPFEIIIHDDASNDRTAEIIREYASRFPSIIKPILQVENVYQHGGLIYPRFVFPRAKGKYIAICEGDDYWVDQFKLKKQVEFLESNSEYVITYADSTAVDIYGSKVSDFGGARRDLTQEELQKCTAIFSLTACFRNIIHEIPQDLLSARYGDLVMWSLLGAHGKGKYIQDIKPSVYRVHEGGIFSKKSNVVKMKMALITWAAFFAYYSRKGDKSLANYFLDRMLISFFRVYSIKDLSLLIYNKIVSRIFGKRS